MLNMRAFRTAATIAIVAAGVAGCNSGTNRSLNAGAAIEGSWKSADGVSATRFAGGNFQTTVQATGEMVADGSYRSVDSRTVQITMRSAIRQTTSVVNCNLVTPDNLACTGAEGQQFALVRSRTG
jgi:hypothetical protein